MTRRPKPASDFRAPHRFEPYSAICARCGLALLYASDIGAPGCITDAEAERRRKAGGGLAGVGAAVETEELAMGIICAVFLLLALVVPGNIQGVSLHIIFSVTWFVLFILEKTKVLVLP